MASAEFYSELLRQKRGESPINFFEKISPARYEQMAAALAGCMKELGEVTFKTETPIEAAAALTYDLAETLDYHGLVDIQGTQGVARLCIQVNSGKSDFDEHKIEVPGLPEFIEPEDAATRLIDAYTYSYYMFAQNSGAPMRPVPKTLAEVFETAEAV